MSDWSLSTLLTHLHKDIERKLNAARETMGHPGTKGDCSENIWLELFNSYLPERYRASKAHVVDSNGKFSDQLDVVIYDRQYSPFVFQLNEQIIIPAESVYAVFETKQSVNASMIEYAQKKVASVRSLHRTSLPIPYAGGTYPSKPLIPIIGGILSLESDWSPALGDSLSEHLGSDINNGLLDIGCVASHGYFHLEENEFVLLSEEKAATAFLFKLISKLQFSGTVPMIDIEAYGKWVLE
ncbi:MAG: hypothetical protein CL693_09815 [Cellvibrionaceae bacterium]|nr:hypothetical protein [Cellvibrionaceae bacterium]|tara:strand:- start:171 stop:890 length:720 start_codon:yes stop_codon:yes gene_type:complete